MVHYDPFSAEVMADPYPVYRQLRDQAPAYYLEEYDAWAAKQKNRQTAAVPTER